MAVMIQAGENPACGVEAWGRPRAEPASSTHLAEGVFAWQRAKPEGNDFRRTLENSVLRI